MNNMKDNFFVSDIAVDLLNLLKKEKQKWQLPVELSNKLKIRREALFEAVDELDNVGYSLEFHPYFGLRFISLTNNYIPGEILDDLNISLVGKSLKIEETGISAIHTAFQANENTDADEGAIFLLNEQTNAVTSKSKKWFSPKDKGIYLSALLKLPALSVDKIGYLTAVGTLSTAYTLTDNIYIPAAIKWPNDIFVYKRKIANVTVLQNSNFPDYYVLGININVSIEKDEFPEEFRENATSVNIELREIVNRNYLLRYLLFNLDNLVSKLRKRKYKPLSNLWLDYSSLFDKANKKGKFYNFCSSTQAN